MSTIGNGQQSMLVTNLDFKIKKRNQKFLYSLFLYIHVYQQVYNYIHAQLHNTLSYIHTCSPICNSINGHNRSFLFYVLATTIWMQSSDQSIMDLNDKPAKEWKS
jgi:hypothetical protein